MTDDLTVLRLDIDSAAMRTLLEAIPGVEPADFAGAFDEADDDETRGTATERTSAPSASRSGPRVGETPPPGAGDQVREPDETDGEREEDGRRRTLLLAGVGATVLAVLAGVAALVYRRRSADGDEVPIPDVGSLLDGDEQASPAHEGIRDDEQIDDDRISADERAASTIDAAPFVGMGALAASAVVARYVRSDDGSNERP